VPECGWAGWATTGSGVDTPKSGEGKYLFGARCESLSC
jgi:hypothetical protein